MKSIIVMDDLKFNEKGPNAEPIHVDVNGRILRFTLKPGQSIREHNAPSSPFYAIILKGRGIFSGGTGEERTFGPGSLLIFDPGENHSIQALEDLVFLGFLHGAPGAQTT